MIGSAQQDKDKSVAWRNENGQLHRENGPAVEWSDGTKIWYIHGQRHRENGPAIEWASGTKEWYINGQLHRENSPAVEYADGTKEWYRHGQCHRENGPAIEYADGRVEYLINDQTALGIERQVKENMARIQAQKEQQEMLSALSQDDEISDKINISLTKISKKL